MITPNEDRSTQTTIVRGICAVLQNMAMPTIDNLNQELRKFGYSPTHCIKIDSFEEKERSFNSNKINEL